MTKEQRSVIGNIIQQIKTLDRYELNWEWMEQKRNGEYVKYDDVFALLKTMLSKEGI